MILLLLVSRIRLCEFLFNLLIGNIFFLKFMKVIILLEIVVFVVEIIFIGLLSRI